MEILHIENLTKEEENLIVIDNMNLKIESGQTIAIKCTEDVSLMLFTLILERSKPSKGNINWLITPKISTILKDEGLYERLTVDDYLYFFKDLSSYKGSTKEIKSALELLPIEHKKIKDLDYSQKGRLKIARALLNNPNLLLVQEPTLYHDAESSSIICEAFSYINNLGISILSTSVSLEEVLLLNCKSYILDKHGFKKLETDKTTSAELINNTSVKITKIPAKIDDRIILFNPTEIDYIESYDGTSYLHVNDDKFPCNMSLIELENKLIPFGFFRCHRSYLVNLQKIRELVTWTRNSYSLILDDSKNNSIPLAKARLEEIKKFLDL